jgi:hypothetical protein
VANSKCLNFEEASSAFLSPDKNHCGTPREWPSFGSPWLAVTCSSCTTARCANRIWANGENLCRRMFGSVCNILLQKGPHGGPKQENLQEPWGHHLFWASSFARSTLLRVNSLVHREPRTCCTVGPSVYCRADGCIKFSHDRSFSQFDVWVTKTESFWSYLSCSR